MNLRPFQSSAALALAIVVPACALDSDVEQTSSTSEALATGYIEFEGPQGSCLKANGPPAKAGDPLTTWPCVDNGTNSLFSVSNVGDGLVELHASPSLCVEPLAGGTTSGTPLQFGACSGSSSQRFFYWKSTSTMGALFHPASQKCVDVQWNGVASGTPLRLWDCNGTYEQAWRARAMLSVADGPHVIYANDEKTKCLDVKGGATANGTPLQVWDCNGTAAQTFTFTNISTSLTQWVFEIRVLGKCVDIRNAVLVDHTPLQIYDCNGTIAQRFKVVGTDLGAAFGSNQWSTWGGNIATDSTPNYYVDRTGASLANGTVVQLYHMTTGGAQDWEVRPTYPKAPCTSACCNVVSQNQALNPHKAAANDTQFTTACSTSDASRLTVYRSTDDVNWVNQRNWTDPCINGSRTYVDGNTHEGVTYHYRVMSAATCGALNPDAWSNDLPIPVTRDWSTPAMPGLEVTNEAPDDITVAITDNSTTEDGFRIYVRGPGDADYVLMPPHLVPNPPGVSSGTKLSYSLPSVTADQEYDIKVTAFNQKDPNDPTTLHESAAAMTIAFAAHPPLPVENLAIDPASTTASTLRLTWTPAEPNVTSFKIVRLDNGQVSTEFAPSHLAEGLTGSVDGQYCFDVYAVRLQQESDARRICGSTATLIHRAPPQEVIFP